MEKDEDQKLVPGSSVPKPDDHSINPEINCKKKQKINPEIGEGQAKISVSTSPMQLGGQLSDFPFLVVASHFPSLPPLPPPPPLPLPPADSGELQALHAALVDYGNQIWRRFEDIRRTHVAPLQAQVAALQAQVAALEAKFGAPKAPVAAVQDGNPEPEPEPMPHSEQ